jgi:hypothetical protein
MALLSAARASARACVRACVSSIRHHVSSACYAGDCAHEQAGSIWPRRCHPSLHLASRYLYIRPPPTCTSPGESSPAPLPSRCPRTTLGRPAGTTTASQAHAARAQQRFHETYRHHQPSKREVADRKKFVYHGLSLARRMPYALTSSSPSSSGSHSSTRPVI